MKECVAYIRISRESENIENQKIALTEFAKQNGLEIKAFFVDEDVSGFTPPRERRGYSSMLKYCEDNNIKIILFYDISRLARNVEEGLKEVLRLEEEGYTIYTTDRLFEVLNQIQYKSLRKLILSTFLAFAEFYREDVIRRTKEGLKRAKMQGKKLGRPYKLNAEQLRILKELYERGEKLTTIAKILNVGYTTVWRYVKRLNLERKNKS